jgi:hypothetical protein
MSESGLTGYSATAGVKKANADLKTGLAAMGVTSDLIAYDDEVQYGYDLTFELEPVFSASIAEGIIFTAGLPFNYHLTPGNKYGDLSLTSTGKTVAGNPATAPYINGALAKVSPYFEDTDPTHLLTITPNVAFFFTGWVLPTEFKLQYSIPTIGKNDRAMHTLGLIIKLYLRI